LRVPENNVSGMDLLLRKQKHGPCHRLIAAKLAESNGARAKTVPADIFCQNCRKTGDASAGSSI
jgi:hypothetical protein